MSRERQSQCIPAVPTIVDPAARQATGVRLTSQLRLFTVDERIDDLDGELREEVAAVIEGSFHIDAAGEAYDLVAGEGILIPRGEPRAWRCTEGPGLLYRVHARREPAS